MKTLFSISGEVNEIESNIQSRCVAEEAIDLICEMAESSANRKRFWKVIEKMAAQEVGDDPPDVTGDSDGKMSYEEARGLESTLVVPFGKHNGKLLKDVPLDYFFWLDSQPDFRRHLRRYLASDLIQQEDIIKGEIE